MKFKINRRAKHNGTLEVTREPGDKAIYSDSALLYRIKTELNKFGFDFIKKRMAKDGHLADESQQYIRSRKPGKHESAAFWWANYAIYPAYRDYNDGRVTLSAVFDIFKGGES